MKGLLQKLFNPGRKKVVTVVSGLPRSGTSMMMKMLEAGGIPPLTDHDRKADDDNPKGYFEFERVKKMDEGDVSWLVDAQGKAVKVISQLLKYLPVDYEYRVIFMRRNMDEILASQKKMLINRGEDPNKADDEEISALFEKHLQSVISWLRTQPNVSALYIHYTDMLTNPIPQVMQINQFMGGWMDTEAMASVVDPNLYRNRKEKLQV
ncbi:MAG: sulfotransferase domain-containing protein [Anaerolineales bacterium]|nr:sulfotransferase domain-containing protein [Anaerolineales bacterium]MCA9931442.1 sulfotransferase domain-containing protein [Anaerolineales bacterium]